MTNTLPQAIVQAQEFATTHSYSSDRLFYGAITMLSIYSESLTKELCKGGNKDFICIHKKTAYLFQFEDKAYKATKIGRPEVILSQEHFYGATYERHLRGDNLMSKQEVGDLENLRDNLEKVFPEITWVISTAKKPVRTPFHLAFPHSIDSILLKLIRGS